MLRRGRSIAILFLLSLSACTQASSFMGMGQNEDGKDDEGATPPVPVNGSFYLACSETKTATNDDPETNVSCAVRSDADKQKISLSAVSSRWDWTYEIPDTDRMGITIAVNKLDDSDPNWHAVYSFKGPDATAIPNVVNATRIQSFAVAKNGGGVETKTFDVKAGSVIGAGNAGASPTPSNGIVNEGAEPVDGRMPSQP